MKHFYSLMDFKKPFKDAQMYHQHAIKYGDPVTKQFHIQAHIKAVTEGNIPTGNDKSVKTNLTSGGY